MTSGAAAQKTWHGPRFGLSAKGEAGHPLAVQQVERELDDEHLERENHQPTARGASQHFGREPGAELITAIEVLLAATRNDRWSVLFSREGQRIASLSAVRCSAMAAEHGESTVHGLRGESSRRRCGRVSPAPVQM